ncbi:hypothetical protein Salat_1548300 [Sesamum alatum]|uniref:Uncharacterized protein n=1 Tax=Sesamum alatum TaxID=300844 RepID=A0AAE1YCV8_9LAMI|nr:hypothetical protein Salat_1548300 [Sesamum alatum]
MFELLEDKREAHIYINGEVQGNEEQGRGEESSSGGEEFEDTDSEYEYKMDEDNDEGIEVGQKQQSEDTNVEGVMAKDIDVESSGDENIVGSEDELPSDKESDGEGKKGATFPVMGRTETVAEAPNEPVTDEASQVNEAENIPQKLRVRRKGKEHVQEGVDVVMHRRTRSGYIPPTSAFKLPPKATTTAPTMFEQFKQCQKGVKIREPAPYVDGERPPQEQASLGSTPSIVKGGKRFITLSNLSQVVSQGKQKKDKNKDKAKKKM